MDRFTRHATEPRPTDEGLLQLVSVVATLPTTILTHLEIIRPHPDRSHQILRQEAVDAYVALYYYTALANVLAQGWLPPKAEFDPGNNELHALLSGLIDRCASDFQYVARVLDGVDQTMVQSSRLQHWARGVVPGIFALPAGIGDLITGLLALPVAYYLGSRNGDAARSAIAWNIFGILDLAIAVGIGLAIAAGPLQLIVPNIPNSLAGLYPAVMIPAFAVPSSILLHALSLRQLRGRMA